MIDFGLLASMIIAIGVPIMVERTWWPLRTGGSEADGDDEGDPPG